MNWDYIIVGAGSAGCALAHALVNSGRNESVLLLEAGGRDHSPSIRFAAAQVSAIAKHDWGYRSEPDPSRNGVAEAWPRGRVLGGCSSINGTMFVRGADFDFNRWAQRLGAPQWSAQEVLSVFREMETSDQPNSARGHEGPLHVRTVKQPHRTTKAFIEAAIACGYPLNDDYNGQTQEGVGYAQLSQRNGIRCSAADAFLKPILAKKNFTLLANAPVRKVEFSGARAVAVVFEHKGQQQRATARDIILCAGAIDSPKLLMMSGVGDARELERHGIDVAINSPEVGCNLAEHPLLKLVYRTRIPTSNLTQGWLQKLSIMAQYLTTREGPIANLFEGAAFLKSSPDERHADIQLHFVTFGYGMGANGKAQLAPYPSVTVLLNKSHPVSRGKIRLQSNKANDPPLIECRILEAQADIDTLVRGAGIVRKIMRTAPIADLVDCEMAPGPDIADEEALQRYVRENTGIAFHPAGTCRMGVDADAVVAPDMRVRGTDNLWIADASIMPDLISGNTNAVCMMMGRKLGKQLATRR